MHCSMALVGLWTEYIHAFISDIYKPLVEPLYL